MWIIEAEDKAILFDENDNPIGISIDGIRSITTRDPEQLDTLQQILKQLRTMTKYMCLITEVNFDDH